MDAGKVRQDLSVAFGAQALFKAGGYIILAVLARELPRESFGQLLYLLALATLLVLLTELGTSTHLVRGISRDPAAAAPAYVQVLRSRVPLIALFACGLVAFVALTQPALIGAAAAIAVFAALKDLHRTSASVLYGLRHVTAAQVVYGCGLALATGLIVFVARDGATLGQVVKVYLIWGAALFAMGVVLVRYYLGPLPRHRRPGGFKRLIRLSLPLFAVDLLALAHLKIDTVMLGLLRPMEEVAAYEAAAKLLEASQFLVRPLTLIFFPVLSGLAIQDAGVRRLRQMLSRLVGAGTLLGLGLAAAVGVAAPLIVPLVFGSGFESSVPLLRILFLSVPGLYLGVIAAFTGNALGIERRIALTLLGGVVLNVIGNAVAIPQWGPLGAAWITLLSQTVLSMVLLIVVWRALAKHAAPVAPAPASVLTA